MSRLLVPPLGLSIFGFGADYFEAGVHSMKCWVEPTDNSAGFYTVSVPPLPCMGSLTFSLPPFLPL